MNSNDVTHVQSVVKVINIKEAYIIIYPGNAVGPQVIHVIFVPSYLNVDTT